MSHHGLVQPRPIRCGRDRLNIQVTAQASLHFDEVTKRLVLKTDHNIKAGSEATITYSLKPNFDLLLQYGFVVPDNPLKFVQMTALPSCVFPSGGLSDAKLEAEKSSLLASFSPLRVLTMAGPSSALLGALRVMCATPAEFRRRGKEILHSEARLEENAGCVRDFVRASAATMLAAYRTTIEDDKVMLGLANLPQNFRNAIQLRMEEKQILRNALSWASS